MALIRPRQQAITRVFPHDRNKRFIIPSRKATEFDPDAPPTQTVPPFISGTGIVGETVTTTDGGWSGSPGSFTYRWFLDGVEIPGEVANSYVPGAPDEGKFIESGVIAINANGPSTEALSSNTIEVTNGAAFTPDDVGSEVWSDLSENLWQERDGTIPAVVGGLVGSFTNMAPGGGLIDANQDDSRPTLVEVGGKRYLDYSITGGQLRANFITGDLNPEMFAITAFRATGNLASQQRGAIGYYNNAGNNAEIKVSTSTLAIRVSTQGTQATPIEVPVELDTTANDVISLNTEYTLAVAFSAADIKGYVDNAEVVSVAHAWGANSAPGRGDPKLNTLGEQFHQYGAFAFMLTRIPTTQERLDLDDWAKA